MPQTYCPDCGGVLVRRIRLVRCDCCGYSEDSGGYSPARSTGGEKVVVNTLVALAGAVAVGLLAAMLVAAVAQLVGWLS